MAFSWVWPVQVLAGRAQVRLLVRGAGVAALAVTVANCSGPEAVRKRASTKDYGVAASPRVIPDGQPIPKGGGRDMVGKPYVVGGRTYVPHPGRGYRKEGWASWYGDAFHGRLTANGEVFDRQSIAAAHPTLPLPSYVRVTNLSNDRSMIVRVNDRGPYEYDRVIDLSEAAANALAFKRRGTTRVRVEFVGRASTNGSDDEKLLATLTTDGQPAALEGSRGTTMLAAAPAPAPVQPRLGPIRTADAGAHLRRSVSDEEDDAPPVGGSRGRAVAAADERAPVRPASAALSAPPRPHTAVAPAAIAGEPMRLRPPERPVFAEIYFADPSTPPRKAGPFAGLKRDGVIPLASGTRAGRP